jgi:hypothetical protein
MYVSETTEFLRSLKKERPQLESEQQKGRALLWDKPALDLDAAARLRESNVPQQGYVYQVQG